MVRSPWLHKTLKRSIKEEKFQVLFFCLLMVLFKTSLGIIEEQLRYIISVVWQEHGYCVLKIVYSLPKIVWKKSWLKRGRYSFLVFCGYYGLWYGTFCIGILSGQLVILMDIWKYSINFVSLLISLRTIIRIVCSGRLWLVWYCNTTCTVYFYIEKLCM